MSTPRIPIVGSIHYAQCPTTSERRGTRPNLVHLQNEKNPQSSSKTTLDGKKRVIAPFCHHFLGLLRDLHPFLAPIWASETRSHGNKRWGESEVLYTDPSIHPFQFSL